MKAPIFVVLAFLVNSALTGVSLSPGLQRKNLGNNCTFQWTMTGTVKDFVIYMNGTSVAQNPRVSLQRDSNGNTINLTITSIALTDAGNYTLSINNGVAWENDSSALLFVFVVSGSISLSQTLGSNPSREGDSVELTCAFTSNSQPVAYRPGVVYSWYLSRFGTLQVLSNGSLQFTNGDIVSGYITRNNGRTLTVSSVQYIDGAQSVYCYVKEDGTTLLSSAYFYLNVQYKPVVTSTTPPSRKYNALVGERVQLSVNQRAYPSLQAPGNNWTFVSLQGNVLDVPEGSLVGTYSSPSLSFILPVEHYGKYSYNMSNVIGTTTITFEVLPPGKPDPPAAFQVAYASHFSIGLQWNCMWSNFNSRNLQVYTQLRESKSNITIGDQTYTYGGTCYNSTTTVPFNLKIQPETSYEGSVWSANEIGSSDITTISLRSAKVLRFIVSSDSIQLNGTTAIINYRIESGNVARIAVTCCYELTAQCTTSYLNVNSNMGQVNVSFGSLPNSTEYVFDLFLYVGSVSNPSLVGFVKGIRVSRVMGNTTPSDVPTSDLAPAVIALAIVLGIAVLAIIGMLIGFLIWKRRHYSPTSNSQELQPNRSGTNQSEAEDYYQGMDRQTSENRVYANLDHTKRM